MVAAAANTLAKPVIAAYEGLPGGRSLRLRADAGPIMLAYAHALAAAVIAGREQPR